MATIQMSRTETTATVTETAVTQRQSLEVVQTMLHSALSTITYLRFLFAESAYDDRRFDPSVFFSYEEYVAGNSPLTSREPGQKGFRLRGLRRGRSKRVDLFLDWLEYGAFRALKERNLRSVKIYLHADPNHRERILEMYTFNITYTPQAGSDAVVPEQAESAAKAEQTTVHATHGALTGLLKDMVKLCQNLPDLPAKRYMSMELLYCRNTPIAEPPAGFVVSADTEPLLMPSARGWEMYERNFNEVDSRFHGASVIVTHFQPINYVLERLDDPPSMPQDLEFTPQDADVANDQGRAAIVLGDTTSPIRSAQEADLLCVSATPSTVVEASNGTSSVTATGFATHGQGHHTVEESAAISPAGATSCSRVDHGDDRRPSRTSQQLLSQVGHSSQTQPSNVPEMRSSLNNMMQPEYFTQGDTQTQALWTLSSPSLTHSQPRACDTPALPIRSSKPALSQSAVKVLEQGKERLRLKAQAIAERTISNKKVENQFVFCQCSHNIQSGSMVQCIFCQTWQHLHCYGYVDEHDEQLPDDHVCYECLFGQGEEETLKLLKDLVMKRRAIHIVLKHGLRTQTELAQTMDIAPLEAKTLHHFLKKEGYVAPVSGSRTRGFSASGKPMFVPVTKGPKYEKMLAELFDPLLHISHHYEVPDASAQRKSGMMLRLPTRAAGMPPPATPASQLRKKKTVKTPASGLDLRESITPFETPRRPRSQSKRPRDDGGEDEIVVVTPRLYRASSGSEKRFKSVRTIFMLDAGGLSSSPVPNAFGA